MNTVVVMNLMQPLTLPWRKVMLPNNQDDLKRGVMMVCDALVNKVDALQWSERQCADASIQINQLNCKLAVAEARAERAIEALKQIASGDASKVSSPIGPLHAAGIVTGWLECKEIAEKALAELTTKKQSGGPMKVSEMIELLNPKP